MYAVIETGGKQYRVEVGTELAVELLEVESGDEITLDRVLLVADGDEAAIGRPTVDGAAVNATVLRNDRGPKLISFKYKPKARRRVKKGHRQELTILRITDVTLNGKSAAEDARRAAEARKTERQRLEEVAATQAAADAALAATLAAKTAAQAPEEAPAKPKRTRAAKAPAPSVEDSAVEPAEGTAPDVEPAEGTAPSAEGKAVEPVEAAAPDVEEHASTRAFEVYEDKAGEWRWRLRAVNGEIVAKSEQGFSSKASLVRSLDAVRRNVAAAEGHEEVASTAEDADAKRTSAGFEILEDKAGQWRWRLRASNGELLAVTEQGFSTKASVIRTLDVVRRNVAAAGTHEEVGATGEAGTTEAEPGEAPHTKKDE